MCREDEDGDERMADLCKGEGGAKADTWEDGHWTTAIVIAARMRVACTRTFCSTLCAEISFRLLALKIRARGHLSAVSNIVAIACVAAVALVPLAMGSKMFSSLLTLSTFHPFSRHWLNSKATFMPTEPKQ